jgi:uncharacterized protein YycO
LNVKLQCGDVILMQNKGFIGKLIRRVLDFFQKDEVSFSHVAIAVSENEVAEALWSGIQRRTLEESVKKARCVKVIRFKNLDDHQKEWIELRAISKIGTNYNYYRLLLQLFDNIFHTNWFTRHLKLSKEWHICSTYVAWVYKALGIYFNEAHWLSVEPDDIDDEASGGTYWEQIYRGQRY